MKPFNLEEFKSGKKALTRDGHIATFGAYNPNADTNECVVGWVGDKSFWWGESGKSISYVDGDWDLIGMAPEKKTVWVNVYKTTDVSYRDGFTSGVFLSEKSAKEWVGYQGKHETYVGTFPLEIEV